MADFFKRMLEWDASISQKLRIAEKPGLLRQMAALWSHSGDSWTCLTALGLLLILGNNFWRYRAGVLIVAILITAVTVLAIKFAIRRERPAGEWGEIYRKTDPHSFPSGHAVRGIMIGVVALGLGPLWFGLVLLFWGVMVGVSRVAMGVHFLSDILAGWLLGIGTGLAAIYLANLWVGQL